MAFFGGGAETVEKPDLKFGIGICPFRAYFDKKCRLYLPACVFSKIYSMITVY